MSRPVPPVLDLAQLYQQFGADLAQAQTREAAVACCVALLDTCFTPRSCQVVWRAGHAAHVLGPTAAEPPVLPTAEELNWLARGEPAMRTGSPQPACFAPLRARGTLLGWLFLKEPLWNEESPAILAAIGALAGPALALLDTPGRQDERVAQLQTLNEIGRLLSGVLHLDTLLEAIYTATRRVVDASDFYIAFYDRATDLFELAYLVAGDEPQPAEGRWKASLGLTAIVVRECQPLCCEDYIAECIRRDISPTPVNGIPIPQAWLSVPMIAHDKLIGVMNVSSYRDGYTYSADHVDLLLTIAAWAAITIENARLYERSERQTRQLATLNRIGRTITSSLDPERVPLLIMDQVTELMGVEEGSLLLTDEASGDLVFTYTTGPVGTQLLGQRLPQGAGVAGYVVKHGKSVIVNDAQHDTRFDSTNDRITGFTTHRLLAVPLRGVGGVQGVIEIINRRDGGLFTQEDQLLLEAMADQAMIALENARRFAQIDQALARRAQELVQTNAVLERNLRSLTALNALGMAINASLRSPDEIFAMTARGIVEMTEAIGARVILAEQDHFRAVVNIGSAQPLGQQIVPLLRQVIDSGRPEMLLTNLPLPLVQLGARALFVVPLRATQNTLGVLCVHYGDAVPDASDQETVVLFATQAAVAVESLALFKAVRGARDQMASILASTREGVMLIEPDGQVALANDALSRLCGLAEPPTPKLRIGQFLSAWEQTTSYEAEEWSALRQGLTTVMAGHERFVYGELNPLSAQARAVEWAALTAQSSGDSRGGALLVLRDITEAKESERLRQDLTNMIVHDLRSPLSSVMASIDMLIKGISGGLNDTQCNILNIAYVSSLQMLEMISTLLDISRLEAGRMPLDLEICAIPLLFDRAAEQLTSLAHDRAMTIQSDFPADLPLVRADGELIIRVLQNLLGNALKFSGRGSTVLVRAFVQRAEERALATSSADAPAGYVTVAVSDCGVGIAPQNQEKIFAKFSQVGERRGGTGLGLTFCKLVIENHGGSIWVESTFGEGSTFFFTLPMTQRSASRRS